MGFPDFLESVFALLPGDQALGMGTAIFVGKDQGVALGWYATPFQGLRPAGPPAPEEM